MPQLRPSGSSFAAFSAAKVQKVCEKRGIWALKVTEGGCFFVTFVFFLMGIVPNNHQNSYNNETIITLCVAWGLLCWGVFGSLWRGIGYCGIFLTLAGRNTSTPCKKR